MRIEKPEAGVPRVAEIDLLRFLAALMVVLFHYTFRGHAGGYSPLVFPELTEVMKYAHLGVALFFMVSGFVILMSASSGSLRKFFVSRVVRLYPAFWVCCTLTFLAIWFGGSPNYSATFTQYLVNMTMLNEFVGVRHIDGVYWTLAIEIKFYVGIALLIAFKRIRQIELFLAIWLVASIALEFVTIERLHSLLIASYAPYFIAGGACFLIYTNGASWFRWLLLIGAWGAAVGKEIFFARSFEIRYQTQMSDAVIVGLVSVFFAIMLLVALRRTGWVARVNWLPIGVLTYPLYLIHQNVGYIIFNYVVNHASASLNRYVLVGATIAVMFALAYLIHALVEKRWAPRLKMLLQPRQPSLSSSV
jgi:peptidoglycan/LPS O-acetylase OafA/YrhL